MSLTVFFDAASRRHNDVIRLPAIRGVSGNVFVPAWQWGVRGVRGTPRRARATVELLRQETPNFLAPNLWPPNSPDLSPVDYKIWVVMQHRIYQRQNPQWGLNLKWQLIDVWCGVEQSIFMRLLTGGYEDIKRVSMLKGDISSTAYELTMLILSISVTFSVTCSTVHL